MSGSSISGNIFLDQNADGSIGTGDTFLSGVVVTLLVEVPATGLYVATANTATTAANGSYSFTGLAAGTYRVDVTAPTGTTFSPAGSSSTLTNATIGTNGLSTTPIVLGSNTVVTNQDAGVYKAASFSGTVFVDNNNDGLEDNADTGLPGVTVQLLNSSGSVVATTTTGTSGTYTFSNLVPGTYSAHVVAPSGSTYSVLGSNATPQPTGGTATPTAPNLITNGQFSTVGTSTFFSGWTESTNTAATPWGVGPGDGPELYNYTTSLAEFGTPGSFSTDTFAGSPTADNVNPYYATASNDAAFFVDDDAPRAAPSPRPPSASTRPAPSPAPSSQTSMPTAPRRRAKAVSPARPSNCFRAPRSSPRPPRRPTGPTNSRAWLPAATPSP